RRSFGAAAVHRPHLLGLARQVAEPGPADRHAAAYRLTLGAGRPFAEPDPRAFALAIAEHLCALFGDQHLRVTAADAPAGKLVHYDALDISGHWVISS